MRTRCTKRRYRDELAAKIALAQIQGTDAVARRDNQARRAQTRSYRCACGWWHLTSQAKVS